MKIALLNLTNTLHRGGIETCMWHVARQLRQRGHEVTLVAGRGPISDPYNTPGLAVWKLPFIPRQWVGRGRSGIYKKAIERLSLAPFALPRMVRARFDGIVANKPYDLPLAFATRRLSGARVAYYSHGGEFCPGYARLIRGVDHFCSCSHFDARDIQQRFGVLPAVNQLGVEVEVFRPRPRDEDLARKIGLPADALTIGTAARLVELKGIDVAIRAMDRLRDRFPNLRFLIAGTGAHEEPLRKVAAEANVADRVHFVGSMSHDDLAALYSLVDVAVFPSRVEAFGTAIAEAAGCGKPVVASRIGGIPEIVVEDTGFLVEADHVDGFAAQIGRLLEDPALRQRFGEAARQRIVTQLSWEATAQRLEYGLQNPGAWKTPGPAPTSGAQTA